MSQRNWVNPIIGLAVFTAIQWWILSGIIDLSLTITVHAVAIIYKYIIAGEEENEQGIGLSSLRKTASNKKPQIQAFKY